MKTLFSIVIAFLLVGCSSDTEPVIQNYRLIEYDGKGDPGDIHWQQAMLEGATYMSTAEYNEFCTEMYKDPAQSVKAAQDEFPDLFLSDEIILQTIWDICENPYR